MARSDLLLSLVSAGVSGDQEKLRSTTEALIAEERAKNHNILADRIERTLSSVPVAAPALMTSRKLAAEEKESILEVEARVQLDQLMLPLPVRENGRQLIEEHMRADVLRAHGFEPRHRVLLSGPPGNGKTSFAEAIAEGLGLPFFVVRYDALIGSYLGETNTRLRKLFDYVRTRPCVLFFDEFDAIGKERGDNHETGEIKRVVSFLLMQLDQLPSYVVTIAATNHAELLDKAVWRRFQIRVGFPSPTLSQTKAFLEQVVGQWPDRPKVGMAALSKKLKDSSFSEIVDFCQNVRRRQILGLGELSIDIALKVELDLWNSRVKPQVIDADEFGQAAPAAKNRAGASKATR
jgi:SpoVK/Ycf46/Vps4 family AAA+-type ATPase